MIWTSEVPFRGYSWTILEFISPVVYFILFFVSMITAQDTRHKAPEGACCGG